MQMKSKVMFKGRFRIKTLRAGTNEVLRQTKWIDNLVMNGLNTGVNIIAQRLINITTYDIVVTQAKIGTGNTAPTASDTDLETPVTSNIPVANQDLNGSTAELFFFIPDGDLPNGTYREFGLFCGNQIFTRALIVPEYTKASTEDTIVEYQIDCVNA